MTDKPQPTLADYFGIVIGPILIMALVGSLVFFLLLILYEGEYESRLHTILFAFVFAVVLIARISMRSDLAGRGWIYGVVLGALVWLGLQRFVEYPADAPLTEVRGLVHLALMGLIWWAAHRLTWDCTHIDDEVEASGKGILESAGLDADAPRQAEPAPQYDAEELRPGILAWWDRLQKYRTDQARRPHSPGVWVVYFSLAALPIFGLGQALIPVEKVSQRRFAFWLMVIYVASGLGLLLTTSFLGMRRYLRQRRVSMPGAMARAWLVSGLVFVLVFLVVCAVLPRPLAEYPVIDFGRLASSTDRDASQWGSDQDSPGKGEGRPASEQPGGEKDGSAGSGGEQQKGSGGSSSGNQGSGGQSSGGQGQSQQGGGQGQSQQGGGQGQSQQGGGQSQPSQSGQQSQGQGQQQGAGQQQGGGQSQQGRGEQGQGGQQSGQQGQQGQSNPGSGGNQRQGGQGGKTGSGQKAGRSGRTGGRGPRGVTQSLPRVVMPGLHPVLKTILLIIAGLVVAFFVLRALLRFLANFSFWARDFLEWLRSWWLALTGGRARETSDGEGPEESEVLAPRRAFAEFANPFSAGWAQSQTPEQLVRYSFEALDAFAGERGLARRDGETPLEFASRVGDDTPPLEADARRLANLYSRLAYAPGRLPATSTEVVRAFWECLEASVEAPLST